MYTQCSKCATVFRLSAEVLRAADGQVRCGRCGEVFNALASLAEQPDAFGVVETSLELETRADEILGNPFAETDTEETHGGENDSTDPDDVQIAQLEWTDDAPGNEEGALEFTLPPGELDRIFVEVKRTGRSWPPFTPEPVEQEPAATATEAASEPVELEWVSPAPEPVQQAVTPPAPAPEPAPAPTPEPEPVLASPPPAAENDDEFDAAARASLLVDELDEAVSNLLPRKSRYAALWRGAAGLLLLTLGAQAVHQNREWLAAHTPFGGALRAIYAEFGAALTVPANLSAYQLRQWGVTGDAGARGTLRVRASILNSAARPQPYPLLRVTLTDRYGHRVGERDFSPAEYLGKSAAAWMAPGMRTDTTIDIVDPGKDAEGFEIDVCLRGETQAIYCENDAARGK